MNMSMNVNMNMDPSRNGYNDIGYDGHMGYGRHVVNLSNRVVMESMKESRK